MRKSVIFHHLGCFGVEIIDSVFSIRPLELESESEVVLDCKYDLREEERGQLDIKWYFNEESSPFLQWLPGGGRRPQLVGSTHFEGHLDLDFKIDEDEYKAYR
jgi:hypothetical protein